MSSCTGIGQPAYGVKRTSIWWTWMVWRGSTTSGACVSTSAIGASKKLNFDNSDKVVLCLTREFIDGSELPGDGARQQQAAAQLHLCLIRRHPTYFHSPTSIATAPTRLHLHPTHVGQPGRRGWA
ncbi:hypothetical protein LSAT2_018417 [Lamellibrachia satsuma]|nr:hypothetical protein LSAT2_018417 [Lamellibrachia satsuma]